MHNLVQLVICLGDTASSPWNEGNHPDKRCKEANVSPRQFLKPAKQSFSAFLAAGFFKYGKHGKGSHHRREPDGKTHKDVNKFPSFRNSRVNDLVVESARDI